MYCLCVNVYFTTATGCQPNSVNKYININIVFSWKSITGPESSRRLSLSHIQTDSTLRWYGCQSYAPAAFTPQEIFLLHISVRVWIDSRAIMQTQGLRQQRIPMTPSGIEPATFLASTNCSTMCPPPILMWKYKTFVPWRCRQQLPPERWNLCTEPHNPEGRNLKHSAL